jgi:hypothetical protein
MEELFPRKFFFVASLRVIADLFLLSLDSHSNEFFWGCLLWWAVLEN